MLKAQTLCFSWFWVFLAYVYLVYLKCRNKTNGFGKPAAAFGQKQTRSNRFVFSISLELQWGQGSELPVNEDGRLSLLEICFRRFLFGFFSWCCELLFFWFYTFYNRPFSLFIRFFGFTIYKMDIKGLFVSFAS